MCELTEESFSVNRGHVENVPGGSDLVDTDQCVKVESNKVHDSYTENLALFYLGLQAKYLVPASTITEIANEMRTLQDIQQEYTVNVLSQELEQYGVPAATLKCMGNNVYEKSPMHEALNANGLLSTHHRRLQYYKTHYNYVQPVEIRLGYNEKGEKRHYYYIPRLESLKVLLKGGAARKSFNPSVEDDVLCDYNDGHAIRSNAMLALDPDFLKVMLFQDAFEVVNPLGSAKQKHNILGVYFTLGNLCPYERSTVDQIQLVLLCLEKDCKYFGVDTVFRELVSDLRELEENGISFDGNTYKGTLTCIMGDNLGSHMIGGFTENFSCAEHFCRYCLITKNSFQCNPFVVATQRDRARYNESVQFLESHPEVTLHEGIKRNSVFNKLSYFHVCNSGLPPCLAHDLFEGVVDYDMAMCLQHLVKKEKWFTYQLLNDRLQSFPSEGGNKPNVISNKGTKLGGHAAENRWLLRLLPVLVNDKIENADNAVWQLVLLLREVVEYCLHEGTDRRRY